jgi:DNA repair protein RadC
MRKTTPSPETRDLPLQMKLGLSSTTTPTFEPKTIARYRVALVREESTPYDVPQRCSEPFAAARFLHQLLSSWDREVMGAIFLDIRNRAIGHQLAYIGTLNRAAVEPRGILSAALLANAAGIILFHNHPSGDPTPSAEDIVFTRRMAEGCAILGIQLVDHLVIGEKPAFVSLRQQGGF